jgi:transposase
MLYSPTGNDPCFSYTYVEVSESRRKLSFFNGIRRCFEFLGGLPGLIVTDNLKSVITQAHRYEPGPGKTLAI